MGEAFMLAAPERTFALVLHGEGWHPGVIGITASRVAEHFHRPAVLLSTSADGLAKGSARSVKGISIHKLLAACPGGLLERFGGHDFAAGLALRPENVPALRDHLNAALAEILPDADALTPEIELDACLDLPAIDERFWRVLDQFGPYGPENQRPLFWGRDLRIIGQPSTVGGEGRHLKLRVAQRAGGPPFSVIGFGLGDRLEVALKSVRRGRPVELAFSVEENRWNGRTSLQLRAKDLRLQEE
jgi:single-stranded-DNA-specific exonuclease